MTSATSKDEEMTTSIDPVPPEKPMLSEDPEPSSELSNKKKKKAWHEPDSSYAWVQVFAAGLIFLIIPGLNRSFSLIYERLIEKYGRSDSVTAWVPSLHGTVRMCSSPLMGYLIQRYSERTVCFFGALFSVVSLILTALSPSIEYVFLFYGLLYGMTSNACIVPGITMVAKYFDKKRGRAMGIAFSFVPTGTLVMSPLIQFLFKEYDYFGTMLIIAAVVMHCAISAMLMRSLPSQKFKRTKEGNDDEDEDEDDIVVKVVSKENEDNRPVKSRTRLDSTGSVIHVAVEGSVLDLRMDDSAKLPSCRLPKNMSDTDLETSKHYNNNNPTKAASGRTRKRCIKCFKMVLNSFGADLLKDPAFMAFCGFMTCFIMCLDVSMSFQTSLLREKGCSDVEVLISFIVFSAFDIPCRLVSGYIFDHRTLRNHKVTVSAGIFFVMGVFLLIFPFALDFNFVVSMICLALTSASRAVVHSQHPTVIAELVGKGRVEAGVSLNRFCQGIGLVISSPLAGFLKDVTGTYATGYILMSCLTMLNTGLFIITKLVSCITKR